MRYQATGTLSSVVAQDTTEVVLPNPADVTTVVNGQAKACESRSLTRGRASTFKDGDGMVTFDGRRTNRPDSPSLLSSRTSLSSPSPPKAPPRTLAVGRSYCSKARARLSTVSGSSTHPLRVRPT